MKFGHTEIIVKKADITKEDCDVIVNAANSRLMGGGGVDGAIHRAGGPSILEECKVIRESQGHCPTGHAVITAAGALPSRHVIHAVGPIWHGGNRHEAEDLRSAYDSALHLAEDHGLKSIAFPSISTGVFGYPIEKAAPIAITAVKTFCEQSYSLEEVRFILFSDGDLEVYRSLLRH